MATGGKSQELDSRVTCSVCLEPYSGRQPKLLPCFHTFCLPCLSELAEASQTKGTAVAGEEQSEETQAASITITCPACRKPTPVPPGGVAYFQSNFYIDDGGTGPQPSPCGVCEGGQEASYECSKCGKFCYQCHRIHNKFCSSTHVTAISVATTDSGMVMLEEKVKNQIQIIQTAVEQLKEDAREINRQQHRIEENLYSRYSEGLRLLAEARDECVKSIRDAAETVKGQLRAEIEDAEKVGAELSKLSRSQGAAKPSGREDIQKGLLSDEDLIKLGDIKTRNKCKLIHSFNQPISSPVDGCFKTFIGTVVISEGNLEATSGASVVCSPSTREDKTDRVAASVGNSDDHLQGVDHNQGSRLADIQQKMENLWRKVTIHEQTTAMLQSKLEIVQQKNASLSSEMTAVRQKNVDLSSDVTKLQREVSSSRDTEKLLEREQTCIKDKNSLLCQDVSVLQGQTQKLDGDVTVLKTVNQRLSSDVSKVQGDLGDLKTEIKNFDDLKTKVKDHTDLKMEMKGVSELRNEVQLDRNKVKGDISVVQHQLSSLQKSVSVHETAVRTIKSRLAKATTQVAFQALLLTDVTVKTSRVLILKNDIINIGSAYSTQTGYFTAPVSGMYIFMATSASFTRNLRAQLDIVHERKDIAYLCGKGEDSSCSCHVAVKMAAGERVFLRTFKPDDDVLEYRFCAGWLTSFSGILVQPEF